MEYSWISLGFLATFILSADGKAGACPREVHFLPAVQGMRLITHVIRSHDVTTTPDCEIECFLEEFCVSYNLGPIQDGKHVCELSDSDAVRHPRDLISVPGYNYRPTVNACTSSPCQNKANCTSPTETDYKCVCQGGYTGVNCETDVDECASNPCDPSANCINNPGSYDCICQPGFTEYGFKCTDIDECASNPCDSSANCTNNPGSYKCICQPGFTEYGFKCTDIDECASNPCDSSADCTNSPGSYECTCQQGFTGDGFTCTASDCATIKKSNPNSTDGLYKLNDPGNPGNAFSVYCDMTSFGGGWTMCYTTNNLVDPKDETTYDNNFPYGTNGYRTNCNNIEFSEIIFIAEESQQKEYFTRRSGGKPKLIESYSKSAEPQGLWDSHGLADASYSYQVMICDNPFYSGFHVSGYTNNCFKKCNHWCGDLASPFFRTSSTHARSWRGVIFNTNDGFLKGEIKLVSVGLR